MADNIAVTQGSGTTIATEDVSGVQHQKVKVEFGGDGVATLVSSSDPLPVTTDGLTDTQLRASAVPVSLASVPSHEVTNAGTFAVQVTSAPTTTVQGTVTANLSATDNTAIDLIASNQTDNSQKTQIVDSSGNAVTVTGNKLDVNASVDTTGLALETGGNLDTISGDTTSIDSKTPALGQALAAASVPVVLPAAQITTLTPQTDSLTDTQLRATPVVVDLGANNDVTVTGSVTANAGTNLNTSALALETGGNLATIAGKDFATQTTLAAINTKLVTGTDIGDVTINNSTGAAAVNIQDGGNTITVDGTVSITANSAVNVAQMNGVAVSMGAGAVGTGVQRITHASDDPVTTALQLIDNSVDGNYLNTNLNYAGTDAATGNGTAAGSLRVSIASDSTGQTKLAASSGTDIGKLSANSGVDIGDVTINNASGSAAFVQLDQSGVVSTSMSNTDGAATALTNFGATASTYNYVRAITVYNSSATAGYVIFTDGSGGTTLWTMPLPAGGGSVIAMDYPIFKSSANTALYFDVSAALSTVYISVSGFRSTT